ncbi:SpoIIE family protein phosphatase [Streptomyces sp. NPDC059373]
MTRYEDTDGGNPPDDLVDAAGTARVTVDGHGRISGWSEGARRLLGHEAGEMVGRPAARLLAQEPSEEQRRSLAELPRWNGRVALRHRDGHRVDTGLLAHRRTNGSGDTEWLLVSPLTGTQARPEDDNLGRQAFAQSPCCTMALYDTRLRLRRANEDMQRAMALTEDDMRGLRVSEIVLDPQSDKTERAMAQVLQDGEPRYVENYLRTVGESHEHAWNVFLSPVKDPDGTLRGVCLAAHDITEQHRAKQRLQLLNDASLRIGTTLDVERTARELAEAVVPALADFVTVDLLESIYRGAEPDAEPKSASVLLRRVAHASVFEGVPEAVVRLGSSDSYAAFTPPAECLATGRPVVQGLADPGVDQWISAESARAERVRRFGMHSLMAVPLRARGTTLGVVLCVRHQRPEPFEDDDVLLASEITARAAVCIDNARRYTRERTTALTLQRSLLPQKIPRQAAVAVASRYLPAGGRAGVGGDWFDVIPLSGARVALVAGDVVGHGIQASATMGRLRTAVRTLADVDLPPDELLTHLDDLVTRVSAETDPDNDGAAPCGELGATCLYAVYDPVAGLCTIARAGHPVPALVTPGAAGGQRVEFLDLPAGPPLGLGGLPFESTEVQVPEGSLIVLYTNGLVESRVRDPDQGLAVLREVLAKPEPTLETVCDHVLEALLPERPADDIALLVARTRVLDREQVATWDLPAEASFVAEARKAAVGQLVAWGLGEAEFTTELVVSELVTNAIRYGEAPIQLRLIHDRTLICEVSDGSNTAPHLRRARVSDEGGRGLLLVAQLCQAWGTRQSYRGKTIWAEQALPVAL